MNKKSERKSAARDRTGRKGKRGPGAGISAAAAWVLILAAPALAVYFVHSYGVNVPWLDEWDGVLPLFEKYDAGTLHFADLWAQHNEHRILFPRLLMLGIGLATDYNGVVFMYGILGFMGLLAWAFIHAFRQQAGLGNPLWLVPFSLLAFSLRQAENMTWAFQVGFMMAATFPILALLSLHSMGCGREYRKFAAAAVLAAMASFSSAQGLLAWPAGVLPLLLGPFERRRKVILLAGWVLLATIAWYTYFLGYARPGHHPELQVSIEYLFVIMGAALFDSETWARAGGVLLLAMLAAAVARLYMERAVKRNAFWLSVIAFSILVQLATMIGRAGIGAEQALATRYPTFTLPAVAALYALLAGLVLRQRKKADAALVALLLLAVAVSLPGAASAAADEGNAARAGREFSAFVIRTVENPPAEAAKLHPDGEAVIRRCAVLRRLGLSFFSSDAWVARYLPPAVLPGAIPVAARFKLDDPNWLPRKGLLVLSGWAIDPRDMVLAGNVYLQLDGRFHPVFYGLGRQDAAATLNDPGLEFSGFLAFIEVGGEGIGRHSGRLWILTGERDAVFSGGEFSFELK